MVDNELDMFTENLVVPEFDKHVIKLCGHDEYHNPVQDMEVMSKWGCQKLQCTHNLQRAMEMAVKNQRILKSALGIKWSQLLNAHD